mmetsp:Transcript_60393/g.155658  ORF Transcript_60393/g.155658 Transcript_60393/m.155658 type:complete len:172 (-) Transcript_60393:76-591(-)
MAAHFHMLEDCSSGKLSGVSQALQKGQDPNRGYAGMSALSLAVEKADPDLAAIVLSFSADPDKVNGLKSKAPRVMAKELAEDKKQPQEKRDAGKMILAMMDEDEEKAKKARESRKPFIEARMKQEASDEIRRSLYVLAFVLLVLLGVFMYHQFFGASGRAALGSSNRTAEL